MSRGIINITWVKLSSESIKTTNEKLQNIWYTQPLAILAKSSVYKISIKIFHFNQPQYDPTDIFGTISERTVSIINGRKKIMTIIKFLCQQLGNQISNQRDKSHKFKTRNRKKKDHYFILLLWVLIAKWRCDQS